MRCFQHDKMMNSRLCTTLMVFFLLWCISLLLCNHFELLCCNILLLWQHFELLWQCFSYSGAIVYYSDSILSYSDGVFWYSVSVFNYPFSIPIETQKPLNTFAFRGFLPIFNYSTKPTATVLLVWESTIIKAPFALLLAYLSK